MIHSLGLNIFSSHGCLIKMKRLTNESINYSLRSPLFYHFLLLSTPHYPIPYPPTLSPFNHFSSQGCFKKMKRWNNDYINYVKKQSYLQLLLLPTFSFQPSPSNLLLPTFSFKPSPSNLLLQTFSFKPSPSNLLLQKFSFKPSPSNLFLQTFSFQPSSSNLLLHTFSPIPLSTQDGTTCYVNMLNYAIFQSYLINGFKKGCTGSRDSTSRTGCRLGPVGQGGY